MHTNFNFESVLQQMIVFLLLPSLSHSSIPTILTLDFLLAIFAQASIFSQFLTVVRSAGQCTQQRERVRGRERERESIQITHSMTIFSSAKLKNQAAPATSA